MGASARGARALVEQLKTRRERHRQAGGNYLHYGARDAEVDAAILEALSASPTGTLREALEPFAKRATEIEGVDTFGLGIGDDEDIAIKMGKLRAARAALALSPAPQGEEHLETADVHCFGRVDGTGDLHPEGSYVSLVTFSKSGERRVHRVSIGAAENLIAEIQGALRESKP